MQYFLLFLDLIERKIDDELPELVTQLELVRVHHPCHLSVRLFNQTYLAACHVFNIMHLDKDSRVDLSFNTNQHEVILANHHDLRLDKVEILLN